MNLMIPYLTPNGLNHNCLKYTIIVGICLKYIKDSINTLT